LKVAFSFPVAISQSLTAVSSPADDAKVFPSGETARPILVFDAILDAGAGVGGKDGLAGLDPAGEVVEGREDTGSVTRVWPVATSHSVVECSPADTNVLPSRVNAMSQTAPVCWSTVAGSAFVVMSHNAMVES
jgi:hypothetical protein